jgi:hypothetical protein
MKVRTANNRIFAVLEKISHRTDAEPSKKKKRNAATNFTNFTNRMGRVVSAGQLLLDFA